uniref:Uncharacterized protein n=1 Tax=Amphimedon queenslandica TaxID=400682 RepID=A0A1X7SUQ6_AMPQE
MWVVPNPPAPDCSFMGRSHRQIWRWHSPLSHQDSPDGGNKQT